MALAQRLELKQGQSLVMTPQLQQAIKLLQLSNLELAEYVQSEIESNPLLERDDGEGNAKEDSSAEAADDFGTESLESALGRDDFNTTRDLDVAEDDLYSDESRAEKLAATAPGPSPSLTDWSRVGPGGRPDGSDDYQDSRAAAPTLKDHLESQLSIAALPPSQRLIAVVLIEAVDESGYLRADLAETAERLGTTVEECETVLKILQGFDPAGVCARDLSECLAAQLVERDRYDPAMEKMLTRLDLVAKRDVASLAALCELDAADIGDMIAEIRDLTPRPGQSFGSEPVQPVIPDIFVKEGADGAWSVELNSDTLPRVLVNEHYFSEVTAASRSIEDKSYLNECLHNANWLKKSLDQRARTILKVASEIVRQQDAFLTSGVRHLRPINLKVVADAIGMHESTVSRVTSNKYMATPRGLFELKYFFTASIASADGGEAHSAEAVRDRIRELVENETDNVLSDDKIVSLLSADGVNIARRTVAKYRDALRIPSSVERRRLMTMKSRSESI
jgi:RNA polymerase sigma-54 factor